MDFHRFYETVFKITEQLIRPALKDPQNGWLYQKEYIFGVRSNLFQDAARFNRNGNDIAVVIIKWPVAASYSKSLTVTHNRIRSSPVRNLDHPV